MGAITLKRSATEKSVKGIFAGKIITSICVLFLIFDSVMKLIKHPEAVNGTVQLGWSAEALVPLGFILFLATILYTIPKTSIIGAIVLTGYLGGAIATMSRISEPFLFPLAFGILIWLGLYLRNEKVRILLRG